MANVGMLELAPGLGGLANVEMLILAIKGTLKSTQGDPSLDRKGTLKT